MSHDPSATTHSRREVLKKAAYVTPTILTLAASPAFAQRGSNATVRPGDSNGQQGNNGNHNGWNNPNRGPGNNQGGGND